MLVADEVKLMPPLLPPEEVQSDAQLLAQYAADGSQEALSQIIQRHSPAVYSTCLRSLGDSAAAEDASQVAFMVLVRRGRTLRPGTVLASWLYFAAQNASREIRRANLRRAKREQHVAGRMNSSDSSTWDEVLPEIDSALGALPAVQREAVVLRYLNGLTLRQAAESVGCPERTLERRAAVALQKLRAILTRRGVTVSAVALAALLSERASCAAPAHLAESISRACAGDAASSAARLAAENVIRAMLWLKVKTVLLTAALVLLGVGLPLVAATYALRPQDSPGVLKTPQSGPQPRVIHAADCSREAVQAAIDVATAGDTVLVPGGRATWDAPVSIPSSKRMTLSGSGRDATVITRNPTGVAINANQSGSRVTAFGFVEACVQVDGDDWRVDHNRFAGRTACYEAVFVRGDREAAHPAGVIDSNSFEYASILIVGCTSLAAHQLWAQSLDLGSSKAVFIEDNTFSATEYSSALESNYGARFVFRRNAVSDMYVSANSLEQGRATRCWEVYDNTFSATFEQWTPIFFRGGTGVIFDNTLETRAQGKWNQPAITLDNVRCYRDVAYGRCDGRSPADGNVLPCGWPARDQIGRGSDERLWTDDKPFPPQTSAPAYFWNNKCDGAPLPVYVHNKCELWIEEGRDYFNGTKRPGYTPYGYPHPLRQSDKDENF